MAAGADAIPGGGLPPAPVVVLAGGTGGAKLARGMLDVAGADLVVVANTGDDLETYRAHVSPDSDLCLFWLADRIDERGWGLRGDSFEVMEALRALGADPWFDLGDRDLAIGLHRAGRLAEGVRLTEALEELRTALGVAARVVPMSDDRVRTRVRARGAWNDFQAFMILQRGQGPIEDVAFDGVEAAAPAPEVLEALATARAIVVGPSNPVISIGPILAVPGVTEALHAAAAPVVAVSPVVAGESVKGPTASFMAWAGHPMSADGIAAAYAGLLDGLVADERAPAAGLPVLVTDTLMLDAPARARLARETLTFADALG